MSKKIDLAKNTLIVAAGKMSTQIVSFLLVPLYTFFLTPYEYGYIDLIITYIVLLTPIITLQLDRAAFRFLIDSRNSEIEKKRVISSTISTVCAILSFALIISLVISNFVSIKYLGLIIISIIVMIFSNLFMQLARGLGQNKKFAFANIIGSGATLIANIILVFILHMGITGIFISMILSNAVILLYILLSLKLFHYISYKSIDKKTNKELIHYALPLVPSGISWWVINVSDRTIISIFISVAANGIYAIANKYAAIFNAIFSIFDMTWTESASMHINSKDKNEFFSEVFNTTIRLFGSLGLLLIALLPLIFNLIINNKFSEAFFYIPILIVASLMSAIVSQYSAIYVAKKLTKKVLTTSISAAIINISLNLILINYIGLYAAALSTIAAFLVMAIFRHFDTKKYVQITYANHILLKLMVSYAYVIYLYYLNNPILNIINIISVTLITFTLNRDFIKATKKQLINKFKKNK